MGSIVEGMYLMQCQTFSQLAILYTLCKLEKLVGLTQEKMEDLEGDDRTQCLVQMIVLIVGICAAVLGVVAVTIYARRALKQALEVRVKTCGKCGDRLPVIRTQRSLDPV